MSDLVGNPEDQLSCVAIEETQGKLEINFGLKKKRGCITVK